MLFFSFSSAILLRPDSRERITSNPFERNSFHLICFCEISAMPFELGWRAYFEFQRRLLGMREYRLLRKRRMKTKTTLNIEERKIAHFISLVISIVILILLIRLVRLFLFPSQQASPYHFFPHNF